MIQHEIEKALKQVYPEKSLWNVSELDKLRLVRLKVWEERYALKIQTILQILLETHYQKLPNKLMREKARNSKGLGIKIATLVGNVSQSILLNHCVDNYPDGENYALRKEQHKDAIMELLDQEVIARPRSVLAFSSVDEWVAAYSRKIKRVKHDAEKTGRKLQRIPWRGNPFR